MLLSCMSETEDNWEIQIWASYCYRPKTVSRKLVVIQAIKIHLFIKDPLASRKYNLYVAVMSETENIWKIKFGPPTATAPRLYLGK